MKGAVVVLAEPGMFENVGLGERISVEKEEMTEGLLGFEGKVCGSEGSCGDSRGEGHDGSRRMVVAFIFIFLW